MKLIVLGLNHETAPIEIREKISFTGQDRLNDAIKSLQQNQLVVECVIISTCNRVEIYCILRNVEEKEIINWLEDFFQTSNINKYLYIHRDLEAVQHLMRVACGLDSMVMGEPQILGQMKEAYKFFHNANTIHQSLEHLFQHTFHVAKKIRTNTEIGRYPVSVAFSAIVLAKQFFGDMSLQTALLIGAGKTTKLIAHHLAEHNIGKMIIANRTLDNAYNLANEFGAYAININEITKHLHEIDLVITSTSSEVPILLKTHLEQALSKRKNQPMFLIDLAVPRDIEPSVQNLKNVYLYTVDNLKDIVSENKSSRDAAAIEAEYIIKQQSSNFITQFQAMSQINPIIQNYRTQADNLKQLSISQAQKELQAGKNPNIVIEKLANQLTNRLLHVSCEKINKAGIEGDKKFIEYAKKILLSE